jgi:hypothetical protein
MTDPFYMLLLLHHLGRQFYVWDMEARIKYLRPGRGRISAHFSLTPERLAAIRQQAATGEKVLENFHVDILDEQGERVAVVDKTLYLKKNKEAVLSASAHDDRGEGMPAQRSPAILSAGWGKMVIAGVGSGKDFKLWPGGARAWDWSEFGTSHGRGIQPGEVEELIAKGCTEVVLTTGRLRRLKVPAETVARLEDSGIQVFVVSTAEGIDIYNRLTEQRQAVGGLFHSTC